jgi:hypothetical protein
VITEFLLETPDWRANHRRTSKDQHADHVSGRRKRVTFIKTISEDQAENLVKDQYEAAQKNNGYVPNYVKAFSLQPEIYDAWTKLIGAIRSKMRLRRYELVTLASAMVLECTY